MSSLKYRPEIDGLRAVAVIPVVLFHLGFEWIRGGYLGVDVFFVISGYLITAILIQEQENGTFSFAKFWVRRIRRILPALIVMVVGTLLISYFIVFRPILSSYAGDALAAIFSYANFAMLFKFGDYWGEAAESSPFLHAWSLSVEEQFYLLYPFLIFLLYHKKVRKKISPTYVLLAIIIISLVLFLIAAIRYPHYAFYLLPTRAWELACGGLLAIIIPRLNQTKNAIIIKNIIPSVGFVLILVSYFISFKIKGIGPETLFAVVGSMMVIGFSSENEPIRRLLSLKPFIFIGKISYSLYLWHWPIIVLAKQASYRVDFDYLTVLFIAGIVMTAASIVSYYFVETPTRHMRGILRLVAALMIVCLSTIWLYRTSIINFSYTSSFATTKFYGLFYDISPIIPKGSSDRNSAKRKGIIAPERDSIYNEAYARDGIITNNTGGTPSVVVLGDSHGSMWAKVIDEIGDELDFKESFYTSVGSNPIFNPKGAAPIEQQRGFNDQQWKEFVIRFKSNLALWQPKILIVVSKWSIRKKSDFSNLGEIIKMVAPYGTKVLLINQPPIIDAIGENNSSQFLTYLGFKPQQGMQYIRVNNNESVAEKNYELRELADECPSCHLMDINSNYFNSDSALIINNDEILYYDDDHLSYQGTLIMKEALKEKIQSLLSQDDW